MSAYGAIKPSMVAFLKEVYGRAKDAAKLLMSQQPASIEVLVEHDDGLVFLGHASIACAATNADFQDRISLHDKTLNLRCTAAVVEFPRSSPPPRQN